MIGEWMLGLAATAALLALAARALEEVLRAYGRPVRWLWASALAGSVLLPLVGWSTGGAFPGGWLRGPAESFDLSALMLNAVVVESASPEVDFPARAELVARVLAGGWLFASAIVLALYGWTWLRLRRSLREWSDGEAAGTRVLVSDRSGPAVVGLMKPAIVLPAWLLDARGGAVALVVRHESEHVRAGDHVLLALAPLVAVAMPWNPAVWWQLRRLRLAVELDCDRRVLAAGVDARAYGTLLLEMAGRTGLPLAGAAALAEPRTFLERRIVAMTRRTPRFRFARTMTFTAAACVLALLACEAAAPTNVNVPAPSHDVAAAAAATPDAGQPISTAAVRDGERIVIIDGVTVDESVLNVLDPATIERVEVVKGEAARERYGHSVATIEITTKEQAANTRARSGEVRLRALQEEDAAVALAPTRSAMSQRLEAVEAAVARLNEDRSARISNAPTTAQSARIRSRDVATARVPGPRSEAARTAAERSRSVELQAVQLRSQPTFARSLMDEAVVIVDGVTLTDAAQLSRIDPTSISSVEIVKGAAAERIGITDGRGVVRITTRR